MSTVDNFFCAAVWSYQEMACFFAFVDRLL